MTTHHNRPPSSEQNAVSEARLRNIAAGKKGLLGGLRREECANPIDYDDQLNAAIFNEAMSMAAELLERRASPRPEPSRDAEQLREAGLRDIAIERKKQVAKWGNAHDDKHGDGILAIMAAVMASADTDAVVHHPSWPRPIAESDPWGLLAKHNNVRQRLVIAGALIVAEIARLDRASSPAPAAKSEDELTDAEVDRAVDYVRERVKGTDCEMKTTAPTAGVGGEIEAAIERLYRAALGLGEVTEPWEEGPYAASEMDARDHLRAVIARALKDAREGRPNG